MLQCVKAGHHAAAFVEPADGVHAAAKPDVQVQLRSIRIRVLVVARVGIGGQRILAQRAQGVVMAGIQGDDMGVVIKRHGEGTFQISAQGLNLRRQPGLRLALGPHQLGAKFGQACRLAFFPHHQLIAELVFPALELTPDVTVRQTQRTRSGRDGALR